VRTGTKSDVKTATRILVEGLSPDDILGMPDADLDELLLRKERIVFSVGTAEILASFRIRESTLTAEIGHIDGGGEGVLPFLWLLVGRLAEKRRLSEVEWLVHAVRCPRPNTKLRRVLERKGFTIRDVPGSGTVYRFVQRTDEHA
jgi:hypothetical protein